MLYLKPPFPVINGVAVFPDHANDRAFYYLPAAPHLSMVFDAAAGVEVPQISLLKFRGGAGNGGFLTFQVDLGIDQTEEEAIKGELRRLYPGDGPILLSPALIEDGSVRLIILGHASDDDGDPVVDDAGQPRFVLNIEHGAKPALYGDNQAVFSVELDQHGVELMEASMLAGELMPIGVIYSLDFYALRPAFSVRITADWNRVQTHLQESFSASVFFASTEIDTVVDKLIEDQVVLIEVDTFLPEGDDAGSWVGRRDDAIRTFKDMVLDNFFKPSLEPIKEEEDGWDKATETAERLALLAATGGWGGVVKFGYVKQDITRIDQKRANLRMNERITVKRSIYPQASMKSLTRVLRDAGGGIDPSRFIQEVTLDDPWFQKRAVTAHALVNFAHDQVASVNLTLDYDGEPRTIRLTKDKPDGSAEWNSVLRDGKMVRDIPYSYRLTFDDVDSGERPGVLVTGTLSTIGDEFEVSPRADGLYFIDDIQMSADASVWKRFGSVLVELRYADPANAIRIDESFLLTAAKPEATWTRFRRDAALSGYEVRITYSSPERRDIVIDWTTSDQERLLLKDPNPLRRSLQVVPTVTWDLVAMVFVELRYSDPANGIEERATLSFFDTPADKRPQTFTVALADAENRLIGYTATFVLKDNRTITIPPSMTAGDGIFLRADMAGHRVVTIVPPRLSFAAAGLVRIEAALSFEDAEAGLAFADRLVFGEGAGPGYFEFDYVAASRARYACRVTLVLANGLVIERDLGSLNGDRLELPSA